MTEALFLICNVCGINLKARHCIGWWKYKENTIHICPHCIETTRNALAIDGFAASIDLKKRDIDD